MIATQQKVYISYAHREDKKYKEYLEETFKDLIFNKTVNDEDLYPRRGSEYIDRLINENYIDEDSLVIVLIGKSTRAKKYVDWEIYTALEQKAKVVGVLLPGVRIKEQKIVFADIPTRFADNVKSGYCALYTWKDTIENFEQLLSMAYNDELGSKEKINNKRKRLLTNEEEYD